jgi:hypothetical protein
LTHDVEAKAAGPVSASECRTTLRALLKISFI